MKALRNQRGSQMIEFVGVLPLFLLMILIVWQFAMAAAALMTAKAAAMDGARVAMVDDSAQYQTAVRNTAIGYSVTDIERSDWSDGTNDYVKVKVTLQVPLLNNDAVFRTTGLSLPVSSEVTLRKEK